MAKKENCSVMCPDYEAMLVLPFITAALAFCIQ